MSDSKLSIMKRKRDALQAALTFALRYCGFFADGTETCDSAWHDEAHGCHSVCPSCGGPVATTSFVSNRRQVTKYTAVSERVAEMLAETKPEDSEYQNLLDKVLTYDKVAKKMQGMGFQPNKCELGDVMCAVRKLVRKKADVKS